METAIHSGMVDSLDTDIVYIESMRSKMADTSRKLDGEWWDVGGM